MQTFRITELCTKIQANFTENWELSLKEYGVYGLFLPVYNGPEELIHKNKIICYISHAYNPDSLWLDLKKDRIDNKIKILSSLDANIKSDLYKGILNNKNELVNSSIFSFLEDLKDWRWRSIFDLLEYAARMSRFASVETEDEKRYEKVGKDGEKTEYTEEIDIKTIVSVNKGKGELIEQSIEARKKANLLLEEIRKEYVVTDHAVQQDFGFSFSETAKRKDILSWRSFIDETKKKGITIR